LTIVPHGLLHYLPFHALFDGESYLLERFEIHYLPAASLFSYCNQAEPAEGGALVFGHSGGGQLPYTVLEAHAVAATVGGEVYLESEATVETFLRQAGAKQVVHLASHGDFRPDNPLFSSLSLADGWLTTLDIFGLKLQASLVTLSGCQTGRSVVGGGDELLGMMRAFLYAGAASLALSLWVVEDRSTALLMENLYRGLAAGQTKVGALRAAQLDLLHAAGPDGAGYEHPYYWAPFILVGAGGGLGGGSD
jgi:CHAT domain-containing protein